MKDPEMKISRRQIGTALAMAFGIGCHADANSAQGVAEQFVDQHYVQINLPAAEKLTTGLAQGKLRESLRLTEGVRIDDQTHKPMVHYKIAPHEQSGDEATFVFDATIQADGADPFDRRWIVLTKKIDGQWKVANFSEDAGDPRD